MTNERWNLPKLPPWLMAVAPFLDVGSWTAVVYLWLGFPLGLFWFIGLVVGFAVGLPLTILWIGFAILAATMAGIWLAEGLERQLAIHLLGAKVPPRVERPEPGRSVRVRDVVGGPALWKGILFLGLRFPLGLVCWIFSLVSLTVSAAFLLAPWGQLTGYSDVDLDIDIYPFFWPVDSVGDLWLLSLIGLLMFIVTLHLHRALAWMWARMAEWLLGAQAPVVAGGQPSRPEPWSEGAQGEPAAL